MVENMTIEELNGAKKCLGLLVAKFAEAFAEACAEAYGCDDSGTPEEEPEATEEDAGEEAGDEETVEEEEAGEDEDGTLDTPEPSKGKWSRVTAEDVEQWMEWRKEGMTWRDIALNSGRQESLIRRHVKAREDALADMDDDGEANDGEV